MKKRTISLLLVLMMLLSLFGGVSAFATDAETPTTETESITESQEAPEADPETGSEETSETSSEEETTTEETTEEATSEETTEEATTEEVTSEEATGEETTEEATTEETSEEESTDEPSLDGAEAPPDEGGGGSVVYTKIDSLADAKTYVAFVSGSKAWKFDQGTITGADVTVSGDSCEVSKGVSAKVIAGASGYAITLDDPPDSPNYMYPEGTSIKSLAAEGVDAEAYAKWNYADGKLFYYSSDAEKCYLKADFTSVTTDASEAAAITLYTGDESSMGGGGGGGSETTDALAPTIITQPVGSATTTTWSEVCELEIEAELQITDDEGNTTTVDSGELSYQWYRDDVAIDGEAEGLTGATGPILGATFGTEYGVHTYYCKVTYKDADGVEHSTDSEPAALILYKGVNENDAILFSDVHQEPENIGGLLNAYMSNNGGNLPGLVFATGDYHNGSGVVNDEAKINASLDAINAMLGGESLPSLPMKVFYLGGNHESSSIMQTKNGGTGLLKSDDGNAYGLKDGEPVFIYTINYDEIPNTGYQSIIDDLKIVLAELAEQMEQGSVQQKPVLIIAHAGLHTLDSSEASGSYNIDYSDQMVDLLNKYGSQLDLYYFFGHNHSKREGAEYKTAGDTIVATCEYADGARYNRGIVINFTYAHMGYLNKNIGGGQTATVMKIGENGATLQRVTAGAYSGDPVSTSKGTLDVPVVKALERTYALGDTIKVEVEGENSGSDKPSSKPDSKPDGEGGESGGTPPSKPDGEGTGGGSKPDSKPDGTGGSLKYTYEWYKLYVDTTNLVDASAVLIADATGNSYTPTEEGYYICFVMASEDAYATTTIAYVGDGDDEGDEGDEPTDTETPKAGDYVIVMQSGDAYYALLSDASGALSAAEVTVENGEVLGPVTDDYIWHFDNPEKGSVKSMNSGKYLMRTSGGKSEIQTTDDNTNKYVGAWVYDAANHILYSAATGGATRYFYPAVTDGAFATKDTTSLTDAGIYLMKVHTEGGSTVKPNTEVKVPPTGDDSGLAIWATAVLTASAALTGVVIGKKKEH